MKWRGKRVKVPALTVLASDYEHGRTWYADARANIERYAEMVGADAGRVADVLALLSPRVSVGHSIRLACAYIEHGSTDGVMRGRVKALERYERDGYIGGPKVRAFAHALRGDAEAVVIDAWMLRLLGEREKPTPKQYARIAGRVRRLASRLDWPNAETQAALWTGARDLVGFPPAELALPC